MPPYLQLNPPTLAEIFEELCLDLFDRLWGGAQLYGRRGHDQKGIDIFGTVDGKRVAVQCKKREGKLSAAAIEKDIEKAKKLDPPLTRLTFATTAKRDPDLQDFVAGLKAPFEVNRIWFWDDIERELCRHDDLYRRWEPVLGAAPAKVEVDRLPSTILPKLIGRDAELEMLEDAWRDREIHVQLLVAVGGAGKTALVHHWMQRFSGQRWKERGAAAAFAWSFYSQGGGDDRQASGDAFIDAALRFFGERDLSQTRTLSPRDRGLRLAELVRRRRTLLILDGLEPLQHPPASAQAGRVKDPAVGALLRGLAADNPGLLVVTTREEVADLAPRVGGSVRSHDLSQLSEEAGAALLRWLDVEGKEEELREVSREVHGHAFTLTLLGTYLRDAHEGDVRAWKDLPLLEAAEVTGDEKAGRVMAAYSEWFGEGPERQLLSLLGLFDRPADAEAVAALRKEPAIPGLTDQLVDLPRPKWNVALKRLRQARLLLEPEQGADRDTLDAHPLVREHFGRVLARRAPEAFQAGHLRLYEHYAAATDERPETLEEMQPLYLAIGHGCRAGRRQEVYDEMYRRRVHRGDEFFSVRKLGAFGTDLTTLAGFFERTWDRPAAELRESDQAWLLNTAAFCLQALGRLAEAVEPMAASIEASIELEDWKNAAIHASNLSQLTLTLGQVDRAGDHARTAVELADRSEDRFQQMGKRSTLADALHAARQLDESEAAFREAEALQAERQPQYPKLYSLPGYRYCDLLLSRAAPLDGSALELDAATAGGAEARHLCEEVHERAGTTLQWAIDVNAPLLDHALNHLSLARAILGLALATGGDLGDALPPLDEAVQGLRQAAREDELPRGLLARAACHRFRNDLPAAERDLAEALEIAERGQMRLYECDAHLEWARLHLSVDDREGARQHYERAKKLVEETGYHRRDRELAALADAGLDDPCPEPSPSGP